LFGPPDTSPRAEAVESTDDLDRPDVDEALEQIDWESCRVGPACGAIVARDGSVLG
jgi:hypothetical protein